MKHVQSGLYTINYSTNYESMAIATANAIELQQLFT